MMVTNLEIRQAKILVVDDQVANVVLLEKILANIGYQQVMSTLDPTAVCGLHQQYQFDLILLDLQMPVMDGYAVMQALTEVEPQSYTPVLVITAQPAEKLRALQAGAKDFVSKPFELVELQTRIANMLEVRLLYRKLADYNIVLEKTVEERTLQLRQSEERFKSFTKLSADWYWEQDEIGNFISAEGPVFEMLGIRSFDDADPLPPASSHPDDDSHDEWNQSEYALLREKIESRTPFLNYVYRRILNNGQQQILQVSGEPIFDTSGRFTGYRGIGMELNDRRRVHPETRYLRLAFDCIDQILLIFDGESKSLIDANQAACHFFASAHRDIANLDLHLLGLREMHDRHQEFVDLLNAMGVLHEIAQLRNATGIIRPVSIQWRAYPGVENVHSESTRSESWFIVATLCEVDSITVFDGLD